VLAVLLFVVCDSVVVDVVVGVTLVLDSRVTLVLEFASS